MILVNKNKKILVLCIIIVSAFAMWALVYYDVSSGTNEPKQPGTNNKVVKRSNGKSNQQTQTPVTPTTSSSASNNTNNTAKSVSNTQESTTLVTPYGQFVSNQTPSLSDYSQQTEVSTCETTPGASCYIEFLKTGSSTIILATQTTDSNGVTSWTWNLNNKGFTVGTWEVRAIAVQGNQTQTATETMIVQQ